MPHSARDLINGDLPCERWIRMPTRGYCPYTGLSRAHFYRLISEGKIKSSNLRRPGQLRGVRLVWLPSVLDYIERHATDPAHKIDD